MKFYKLSDKHTRHCLFTNDEYDYHNKDLKQRLLEIKAQIDEIDIKKWEKFKKIMNDYELIYTSSNRGYNVCNILPVSRSYFKLHEMIYDYNLLHTRENVCCCIAEGPGGFLHCLNDFTKYNGNCVKKCYGITLSSKDKKIPYWNQLIVNNSINHLFFGKDMSGNIYKKDIVDDFVTYCGKGSCNLVTADGGFDYSDKYHLQEESSYRLLYSEILIALQVQKLKGNFVIKVFDLFSKNSVKLLYILYLVYESIEIFKPYTSRKSNSEKYIVCRKLSYDPKHIVHKMNYYFNEPSNIQLNVPDTFYEEILRYNNLYTEQQISKINEIKKVIDDITYKTNSRVKEQVEYGEKWCELYKLPINNKSVYNRLKL